MNKHTPSKATSDKKSVDGLSDDSPHVTKAKCIECGEPTTYGNKFCKKSTCRNKNMWRKRLTPEIEMSVREDERKKLIEQLRGKMDVVTRSLFRLSDLMNQLKEGKE